MVSTVKFSEFANGGTLVAGETTVGLESGINTKFTTPPQFVDNFTNTTQPTPPSSGMIGYNTDILGFQYYNGTSWLSLDTTADLLAFIASLASTSSGQGASLVGLQNQGSVSGKTVQSLANAQFIVQTNNGSLANAQSLGSLSGGVLKSAVTSGIISISLPLTSIDGLSTTANQTIYTTGSNVYATTSITPLARSLIADSTTSAMQSTLGLGSAATHDVSFFLQVANNLSDVSNAATARLNLGLGSAATKIATDNTQPDVASVKGSFIAGHVLVAGDTLGTVTDGGSPAGMGTVTNIATGTGLTGGPITTTGSIEFANITNDTILSNISGSSSEPPVPNTLTAILDSIISNAQGTIIYRNASSWVGLAPGTSGFFLKTLGSASNPIWDSGPVFTSPWADGVGSGSAISTTGGSTAGGSYDISFGLGNTVTGDYAFSFGNGNTSSGDYSFSFGLGSTASGNYSWAIGNGASSNNAGSLVWIDSTGSSVSDTASNQCVTSFSGGYYRYVGTQLALSIDTNSNIINYKGIADQSKSYQVPTTGFSITIASGVRTLTLAPTGTLATGTIVLPVAIDGQVVRVNTSQTITALTITPHSGDSINNAPTTLSAGNGFDLQYNLSTTTWNPLYQSTSSGGGAVWTAGAGTGSGVGGDGSNTATGNYALSYGSSSNSSSGNESITFGIENSASGTASFAGGSGSNASADYAFAWGESGNSASGTASFAGGSGSSATGTAGFAWGQGCVAAAFSTALMYQAHAAEFGFAAGARCHATNEGSHVIGDSQANPATDAQSDTYVASFNGGFNWYVNTASTPTLALAINSSGTITNAQFPSGTWPPVITASSVNPGSISYAFQVGEYQQVGNIVFYTLRVVLSAFTLGSGSGQLQISGPPITAVNVTANDPVATASVQNITIDVGTLYITGRIVHNTQLINLDEVSTTGGTLDTIAINNLTSSSDITISGFYFAA